MSAQPWFHGKISKTEAAARLRHSGKGSYLIRAPQKRPDRLLLLICRSEDEDAPLCLTITVVSSAKGKTYLFNSQNFASLDDIIRTILKTPIRISGEVVALAYPASQQVMKSGDGPMEYEPQQRHRVTFVRPANQQLRLKLITSNRNGLFKHVIKTVDPQGLAGKAGLTKGDEIHIVNGVDLSKKSYEEVIEQLRASGPKVSILYSRHSYDGISQPTRLIGLAPESSEAQPVETQSQSQFKINEALEKKSQEATEFILNLGQMYMDSIDDIPQSESFSDLADDATMAIVCPSTTVSAGVADEVVEVEINEPFDDLSLYIAPMDIQAFDALSKKQVPPQMLPKYAQGKKYNRYFDILPNPLTRVILPPITGVPPAVGEEYTYINANYVRGYGGQSARFYIAAQGPTMATLSNFIRMIWHEQIVAIVMTTGLVEKKRTKCERYWPESPEAGRLQFGDISVRTVSIKKYNKYEICDLELSDGERVHKARHFWFTAWPDHGIPVTKSGDIYPDDVLSFLESVRSFRQITDHCESPALVHCSAGVGRTGTFITIEHVMDAIKARANVDMNEIIADLREDRMALVQHTCQYKFAYQACINFAKSHVIASGSGGGSEIYALASSHTLDPQAVAAQSGTWKRKTSIKLNRTLFAFDPNSPALKAEKSDMVEVIEGNEKNESSSSTSTTDLESQPWFRAHFSRLEVAQTLEDKPEGSFLVRPSSNKGSYALAMRLKGGKLANFLVVPVHKGDGQPKYTLGKKGGMEYNSVVELVADLVETRKLKMDGEVVQLLKKSNTDKFGRGSEA